MSDVVTVSNRNGVAIVTLQNPPVNGLGFAVRTELEAALRTATDDDTVQALVITGDGKEVHRKRIDLSGTGPFGKRALSETLDLSGKTWVRIEAWDVAANGVISQPIWLK